MNLSLGFLGWYVKETAAATHSLTCGVPDRESNEVKYLRDAAQLIEEWQRRLQGVPPVNLQLSEQEDVMGRGEIPWACRFVCEIVNLNLKLN